MSRLLNYFFKGIVFLAPFALTIYVCVRVFTTIDGWLGIPIPGVGFVATVVLITLFGYLAQGLLTRSIFGVIERVLDRLPFVRLLYSSTKDLLNAFVGEQRRFDKPVTVLYAGGPGRAIGFVTQQSLATMGLSEHVTVYMPTSYSVAGHVIVIPVTRITRLEADAAEVMAFIVSGGVTALPTLSGPAPPRPDR